MNAAEIFHLMDHRSAQSAPVKVISSAPGTATTGRSNVEFSADTWHVSCSSVAERRERIRVVAQINPGVNPVTNLATPVPVPRRSLRFIVGIVLMTGSFLVYPTYPIILLWLPLSLSVKTALSITVWVLSWATFSAGALLAGPQGYAWIKGLWWHMIAGSRPRKR